jgi:hypothetical protein
MKLKITASVWYHQSDIILISLAAVAEHTLTSRHLLSISKLPVQRK